MKKRTSNIERRTSNVECRIASRSYLFAGIQHRASSIQKRRNHPKEPPKGEVCENCRFSQPISGLKDPTLICGNKANARDKCVVVDPASVCPNFDDPGHSPVALAAALAEGAKLIPLSQGKVAIVDAEDYPWLNKRNWYANRAKRTYYARGTIKGKHAPMHRQILNAPPHLVVDHINRNGLDNRKSNLRLCTHFQNQRNRRPGRNGSSKYKGVRWSKRDKKFRAGITCNRKSYHLGMFESEIDAAKAYDNAAKKVFGEFAYLNFPEDGR